MNDCSELLAALEALTTELQAVEARNVETSIPSPAEDDDFVEVTLNDIEEIPNDDKKNLRSIDLAEKEKLLTECKNQIQVSWLLLGLGHCETMQGIVYMAALVLFKLCGLNVWWGTGGNVTNGRTLRVFLLMGWL